MPAYAKAQMTTAAATTAAISTLQNDFHFNDY